MTTIPAELKVAKVIWDAAHLPPEYISRLVLSKNPDPAVNSSFRLGTAAQVRIRPLD